VVLPALFHEAEIISRGIVIVAKAITPQKCPEAKSGRIVLLCFNLLACHSDPDLSESESGKGANHSIVLIYNQSSMALRYLHGQTHRLTITECKILTE
jgi:hypothetical protein